MLFIYLFIDALVTIIAYTQKTNFSFLFIYSKHTNYSMVTYYSNNINV